MQKTISKSKDTNCNNLSTSQSNTSESDPSDRDNSIVFEGSSQSILGQVASTGISNPTTIESTQAVGNISIMSQASVRVPFPVFKSDDIVAWFRRLEYWFDFSKVESEKAKFALIVSQIDNPMVTNLDELLNPDNEKPYSLAKAKIISIFEQTISSKINKLLSGCQLGDLKPSQLLAEMKRIGGNVGDDILRNLWSKRLPMHLQPVVAAATKSSLEEIASIADAVIDVVGPVSICNVNQTSNSMPTTGESSELSEIQELRLAINQLTKSFSEMKNSNKTFILWVRFLL